jgi:hypothetical protein
MKNFSSSTYLQTQTLVVPLTVHHSLFSPEKKFLSKILCQLLTVWFRKMRDARGYLPTIAAVFVSTRRVSSVSVGATVAVLVLPHELVVASLIVIG